MTNGRYELEGNIYWYRDEVLHRVDGPAFEDNNGYKEWWVNGTIHREDGPAVESMNGYKKWYRHGKLHRLDGPAIEYPNGSGTWFVDGQEVDVLAVFGHLPSDPLSAEEQMVLRLSV